MLLKAMAALVPALPRLRVGLPSLLRNEFLS
jgi:hypothetical protein